jgi:hypothetical protein
MYIHFDILATKATFIVFAADRSNKFFHCFLYEKNCPENFSGSQTFLLLYSVSLSPAGESLEQMALSFYPSNLMVLINGRFLTFLAVISLQKCYLSLCLLN